NVDRNLHHLFRGGHLDIQISRHRLSQDIEVAVLNVPAIAPQVNRDAVGSGLFANHGRGDDARLRRAPRLAHSGDVIDVDVQSSSHTKQLTTEDTEKTKEKIRS